MKVTRGHRLCSAELWSDQRVPRQDSVLRPSSPDYAHDRSLIGTPQLQGRHDIYHSCHKPKGALKRLFALLNILIWEQVRRVEDGWFWKLVLQPAFTRVAKLAKRSRLSSSEINLVCLLLGESCCQGLFILLSSAESCCQIYACEKQCTSRHGEIKTYTDDNGV